jgi:hypothetical protein
MSLTGLHETITCEFDAQEPHGDTPNGFWQYISSLDVNEHETSRESKSTGSQQFLPGLLWRRRTEDKFREIRASLTMNFDDCPFELRIRYPIHDSVQRFDKFPLTFHPPYGPYNQFAMRFPTSRS